MSVSECGFEFQKWPVYQEAKVFAVTAQRFCVKLREDYGERENQFSTNSEGGHF